MSPPCTSRSIYGPNPDVLYARLRAWRSRKRRKPSVRHCRAKRPLTPSRPRPPNPPAIDFRTTVQDDQIIGAKGTTMLGSMQSRTQPRSDYKPSRNGSSRTDHRVALKPPSTFNLQRGNTAIHGRLFPDRPPNFPTWFCALAFHGIEVTAMSTATC